MFEKLQRLIQKEAFRYLICGALTVVVNIAAYKLLKSLIGDMVANTIAFFIAVLFAYWTNSTFVFHAPHTRKNFFQFFGMRTGTLVIDDGGMYLLLTMGANDLLAKCLVNIIIIIINYLASKWIIFHRK